MMYVAQNDLLKTHILNKYLSIACVLSLNAKTTVKFAFKTSVESRMKCFSAVSLYGLSSTGYNSCRTLKTVVVVVVFVVETTEFKQK